MGINRRAQVAMTADEAGEFLARSRTATLATVGLGGQPHLVAMWYAVLDGDLWFETKAKSQKAVNLRRDPRVSVLVEAGRTYDSLRGVEIEGSAELTDEAQAVLRLGIAMWERYVGPYTDDQRPGVDAMMDKRVCVRVRAARTRTWDHRKLGLPAIPVGGSTAEFDEG
ncbi:PPOX class F420-dependent oxidoreductase [Tsukamurella soli]|uniref:PPOX class F420-dependent oxidoreductase n=1 Tax=Tsukamurella soli TaxID=644556 RepID=A0ABP8JRV2_9ACTN